MGATHTSGPWKVVERGASGQLTKSRIRLAPFCTVQVISDNSAEDADLISAAPDMLKALEGLLNCIDPNRDWREAKAARAAIAKARGKTL